MQTYSLASIVEPVLNMEEGTLFQEIAKDPEKFNEDIVRSGLTDVPFILGQDWLQAGSDAVMLTKGSPIWKSIRGVSRIISNATGVPNDPEISATMELNQYLVGEITGHVETIKRSILASRTNGGIYSNNKINMTAIVESLDAIIEYCLSSPDILTKFFAEIKKKRPKDRDSVLENSINATFISMFILNDQDAGVTKEDFIEIGCCAMFKDISRILYPGRYGKDDTKAHPAESARIVKELDLPDSVGHLIQTHHDIDYGRLMKQDLDPRHSTYKKILDVVEIFVLLTTSAVKLEKNLVVIGLSKMAADGFLDKKTVKSLASMYGGKDKSLFLSQGVELLQSCPMGVEGFERYLWDAKYPMRVICNAPKGTCDCLSRNRYVNVKVTVEQQDPRLGLVPPGNYHYCLCLTDEMMEAAKHVYSQEVVSKIAAIIKRK